MCAIYLLQSIWHEKKDLELSAKLQKVHICMEILGMLETR